MAARMVVLGWAGECVELASASDAGASVNHGVLRVSLTMWAGPLADATVLMFDEKYLDELGGRDTERAHRKAMKNLLAMPLYKPRTFTVETPIPVGMQDPHEKSGAKAQSAA